MKLHVLNPVAQKAGQKDTSPTVPAPRLPKLDRNVIGLYWNYKPGGDAALRRTGELLKARYPGLEIKSYEVSMGSAARRLTTDGVKQIAQECVAVIGSTAD